MPGWNHDDTAGIEGELVSPDMDARGIETGLAKDSTDVPGSDRDDTAGIEGEIVSPDRDARGLETGLTKAKL
jgi:hypothetical protein